MTYFPILAHGVLGNLDEALLLAVAMLFILTLITSWLQSRRLADIDQANSDKRGELQ